MKVTSAAFEQAISEVACMVHDLRNPLAAIHGGAELLVHSKLSEPQVHRIARNMYGASLRMKELLDEFLSRSTVMDGPAEPSDLSELIRGAVDKVAALAESQSVHILQDVPDRHVIVLDRRRIRSVVVNLLVNALEAMPHGGTIRVSAVREPHAVVVRVRDTGPESSLRFASGSSSLSRRQVSRAAPAWASLFRGKRSSTMGGRCGPTRPREERASLFACPSPSRNRTA